MRILKIVPDTVVDGPGLRTSIYFAGCKVHCEGCHNLESWDLKGGTGYHVDEVIQKIEEFGNKRVTLTGGNPLDQKDLIQLTSLCIKLKDKGYNIWMYSGYTWEEILEKMNIYLEVDLNFSILYLLLQSIDVIVDGPFIQSLRDTTLQFRGSSNQRLIDVQESLKSKNIVLYEDISTITPDNRSN